LTFKSVVAGRRWLPPVILASEAEIRKIAVLDQPRQIADLILEKKKKKKAGGVAEGVGPEFKP
jgi:hypothetical protein